MNAIRTENQRRRSDHRLPTSRLDSPEACKAKILTPAESRINPQVGKQAVFSENARQHVEQISMPRQILLLPTRNSHTDVSA
jgi:hypothetical protein